LIDVISFCKAVQNNPQQLKVQTLNSQNKIWQEEYYAVSHWLKTRMLEQEVNINQYKVNLCYTAFSTSGQVNFSHFFVDAYVTLKLYFLITTVFIMVVKDLVVSRMVILLYMPKIQCNNSN